MGQRKADYVHQTSLEQPNTG